MSTTARISNIDENVSKDDLMSFLDSKGLPSSLAQQVSLTSTRDGRKIAVVSFKDAATLKRALDLPLLDRTLKGGHINIDDDFDGFITLAEGSQIDIVALHGLNGHPFHSWEFLDQRKGHQGQNFMWLRDGLPEQLPGARIMIYGYNANVVTDVSTGRIRTFAETFLEKLQQIRENTSSSDRPLILIAHSMGGLIVKQASALLIANTRADKRFDSTLNAVNGIVFIGTPHSGGNGVNLAKFVGNFMKVFGVDVRIDLLKSLDTSSMVLFDLTDDFRQLVAAKGIEITTLFETKKTKLGFIGSEWIVEERSAILGVARERKIAINANHANLCKFNSSTNSSLVTVVDILSQFCKEAVPVITSKHASTQPPPPEGLKYSNLSDPDKLDSSDEYPVLVLGRHTYWALSHIDNRYGMTILAYDNGGNIVGKWFKGGARYIHRIEYSESARTIAFIGQGNLSIVFSLSELRVVGSPIYF